MPDGPRIPSLPWKQDPNKVSRAASCAGDKVLGHTLSDYWKSGQLAASPLCSGLSRYIPHTPPPGGSVFLRSAPGCSARRDRAVKSSTLRRAAQGLAWGCSVACPFTSVWTRCQALLASDSPRRTKGGPCPQGAPSPVRAPGSQSGAVNGPCALWELRGRGGLTLARVRAGVARLCRVSEVWAGGGEQGRAESTSEKERTWSLAWPGQGCLGSRVV